MADYKSLRYSRQRAIKDIGKAGQERICNGKVFIIGCGALGSMAAMELAGAGVGHIALADFDLIDESNLQRQFFFKDLEKGKNKAVILKERICDLNPEVEVLCHTGVVTNSCIRDLIKGYNLLIDATDNPATKLLVDSIGKNLTLPVIIGGVTEFSGQVFTLFPDSIRYSDIFEVKIEKGGFLPCSAAGVWGPCAAICASLQASEGLKILSGLNTSVSRGITFDLRENRFHNFLLPTNS